MKKFCICSILLLLMFGCSKSGLIEQRIGQRIDKCKSDAECIIRISEVTDFQWDKMYAFDYGLSPEEVERALGTPAPNYEELKRWWVFLKDGKIVYREIEPTDIEGVVDGEVSFNPLDDRRWQSFTPENAIFNAEKQNGSQGKVFYKLNQIIQ